MFLWSIRSVEHDDRGRTLTHEWMPAEQTGKHCWPSKTIVLQRLQSISRSLRNHSNRLKNNIFGPLFVVREKNIHKIINWKGNIRKATSKPPRKTPGSSCPKKQGNFPHGGNFCYFSAQRAREGPSGSNPPTPKSFLVHLWQEGVIWTSQTDFSTQIKWWFSNCAKLSGQMFQWCDFGCDFFCIWQWMKSGSVMQSHPTNWDLSWPDVTTDDCWPLIQPIIFSLSYCHPGPHVPTQKGKIRSPPVYHPNVRRHCHRAFRTCKNHFKENPCVRRIGILRGLNVFYWFLLTIRYKYVVSTPTSRSNNDSYYIQPEAIRVPYLLGGNLLRKPGDFTVLPDQKNGIPFCVAPSWNGKNHSVIPAMHRNATLAFLWNSCSFCLPTSSKWMSNTHI